MNKNAINNGNNCSIHVIPIDNYSLFFTPQLIANKNYQRNKEQKGKQPQQQQQTPESLFEQKSFKTLDKEMDEWEGVISFLHGSL